MVTKKDILELDGKEVTWKKLMEIQKAFSTWIIADEAYVTLKQNAWDEYDDEIIVYNDGSWNF